MDTMILWTIIFGGIIIIGFGAFIFDLILFGRKLDRESATKRSGPVADATEKETLVRIKLLKEISSLLEQKKASKA